MPEDERDEAWQAKFAEEQALWGEWDDSMKSVRLATEADLEKIKAAEDEMRAYQELKEAEAAKGKKGKDPGPPPASCDLILAEPNEEGEPMVEVVYAEPYNELSEDQGENQNLQMKVNAVLTSPSIRASMMARTCPSSRHSCFRRRLIVSPSPTNAISSFL